MIAKLTALLGALLVAVVPVVPARCPCPAAPAAAKVCGSDYTTYDSQCHLECAAVPGRLAAAHPGPCSATESALGPLSLNATLLATAARPPGYPADDYARIQQCIVSQACADKACSECRVDSLCDQKCKLNCICGCYGQTGSSLENASVVFKCVVDTNCLVYYDACRSACPSNSVDCRIKCYFSYLSTLCRCNTYTSGSSSTASWRTSSRGPSWGTSTPADSGASALSSGPSGLGMSVALAVLGALLARR
ncbi:Serine protease inhibitor Kazal-type 7 [Frankliniella fusca]|uniref:Serine protease inhibitor Kazal-type 7 n=1 Tax=Frankliniella fusca TaxID=407009 RepID=A0AAE1LIX4_9NEOP|nr:Serine protease inhibitor Kazal-type 7 [Frankliniella fusca]